MSLDQAKRMQDLYDENRRLRAALDIAQTALLNIERRSEEGRATLSKFVDEQRVKDAD
jgi:hypothetical protein